MASCQRLCPVPGSSLSGLNGSMMITCSRGIPFLLAASPHYLLCVFMLLQKLAPCHLAPDHDVRRAQQCHPPPMVLRLPAGVATISLSPRECRRHEDIEKIPAAVSSVSIKDLQNTGFLGDR